MCYFSRLEHIAHYKAKNWTTVKTNFCKHTHTHAHTHAHACTHAHAHTHTVNRIAWKSLISQMNQKMWVCLMIEHCKGDYSRWTVQQKKKISYQLRVYRQREDREWKYQKKSVASGLIYKLWGVQSSIWEQPSWGSCSTEKQVCTVFVNRGAASGEKLDEERYGWFGELSGQGKQRCFELFVVCLRDTEGSQTSLLSCYIIIMCCQWPLRLCCTLCVAPSVFFRVCNLQWVLECVSLLLHSVYCLWPRCSEPQLVLDCVSFLLHYVCCLWPQLVKLQLVLDCVSFLLHSVCCLWW